MVDLSTASTAAEIVALINSRPNSPRVEEIERIVARSARPPFTPSDGPQAMLARVRDAVTRLAAAEHLAVVELDDEDEAANAHRDACWAEVYDVLAPQIPDPPRSFEDIVAWALIAYHGADKTPDDESYMRDLDKGDCVTWPAANLIQAVLLFSGDRPWKP